MALAISAGARANDETLLHQDIIHLIMVPTSSLFDRRHPSITLKITRHADDSVDAGERNNAKSRRIWRGACRNEFMTLMWIFSLLFIFRSSLNVKHKIVYILFYHLKSKCSRFIDFRSKNSQRSNFFLIKASSVISFHFAISLLTPPNRQWVGVLVTFRKIILITNLNKCFEIIVKTFRLDKVAIIAPEQSKAIPIRRKFAVGAIKSIFNRFPQQSN